MQLNHYRAGAGEPLLLLHGIGSHWQMWEPVLPMLTTRHDVIAVDLPGFGESAMPPPGTPPGLDSLCELVLGFLAEHGIERPHIAGNSLGGMIALELARRGQARTVCALSPSGFFDPIELRLARGSLWVTVRFTRLLAPYADGLLGRPGQRKLLMNLFMAHPDRLPPAEAAASFRGMAGAPGSTTPSRRSRRGRVTPSPIRPSRSRSAGARRTASCSRARASGRSRRSPVRSSCRWSTAAICRRSTIHRRWRT